MKIYYTSLSGNVKRFVERTGLEAERFTIDNIPEVTEPYVLITYTFGIGQVPEPTQKFLLKNGEYLKAVAVSGNKLWGEAYGRAGDLIADQFDVPLLIKFELGGTDQEVAKFKKLIEEMV